ncbi:MAG: glycosyltransferase family 2 protein [Verrucomicrobiota bacterium]
MKPPENHEGARDRGVDPDGICGQISVLILTYTEAPHIGRTLAMLGWARRVLILDSFSCDETLEIAAQFSNVDIVQRKFDSFAEQCNFGLSLIQTTWVLSLDADYVLTNELIEAISAIGREEEITGYTAAFEYCVYGKPLRKTVLPARTILYQRESAHYQNEGHSHRVHIEGTVAHLPGFIRHDDRKPLSRWFRSQISYMELEAPHLQNKGDAELSLPDRLRKRIVYAPMVMFFYTLLWQRLILDGWHGWFYVCQRTIAELILSIYLLDGRLKK